PRTYGRRESPPSKARRTSSLTSGTNQLPRFFPPISVASLAQASYRDPPVSEDHGSVTLTRPCPSGPLTSLTIAGNTPDQRPPTPAGRRSAKIDSGGEWSYTSAPRGDDTVTDARAPAARR